MTDTFTLTNPLSSVTEALLHKINRICGERGIPFFIAGATAREIIIHHVHGRSTGRRTRDIDFAVFINGWELFEALKQAFIAGGAQSINGNIHRIIADGIELDIIPFGGVAEGRQIAWPPDRKIIMSVDGFEDALTHTVQIELQDGEIIPFCSLPGLAMLKLFAWRDRGASNAKDATDLYKIINEYSAIENTRIYAPPVDCNRFDWEPVRMGAFLLGSDIATICASESHAEILRLDKERLTDAIIRQLTEEKTDEVELLIEDFWKGINQSP